MTLKLKTSTNDLETRGFLAEGLELEHSNLNDKDILLLLKSDIPKNRTMAARLVGLTQKTKFIPHLIDALKIERKLYSKIEICNALIYLGPLSIEPLIELLGEVGSNQHKNISEKAFKKDSYPLPRDVAARTLIRIGSAALPYLFNVLNAGNIKQVSEALDAIGYINFYQSDKECFDQLANCYFKYEENELLRWKVIRSLSGCTKGKSFLESKSSTEKNPLIKQEIARSLRLIKR